MERKRNRDNGEDKEGEDVTDDGPGGDRAHNGQHPSGDEEAAESQQMV